MSGIGAIWEKIMIHSDKTCKHLKKSLHSNDEFEYSNPKFKMTNIDAQKKGFENEKLLSGSEDDFDYSEIDTNLKKWKENNIKRKPETSLEEEPHSKKDKFTCDYCSTNFSRKKSFTTPQKK